MAVPNYISQKWLGKAGRYRSFCMGFMQFDLNLEFKWHTKNIFFEKPSSTLSLFQRCFFLSFVSRDSYDRYKIYKWILPYKKLYWLLFCFINVFHTHHRSRAFAYKPFLRISKPFNVTFFHFFYMCWLTSSPVGKKGLFT